VSARKVTDEELKAKLGEELYEGLIAHIRRLEAAAWQRGLRLGRGEGWEEPAAWLKGALKSWTNWFGALLIAAPELLAQIAPHLQELLTPQRYARFIQIAGIVVILLRIKTSQSLKEKGS
jgi:hypothetical protein